MAKIRGETRVKTLDAEQEIATLVAREERMRLTLTAGRIHTWDWNIATDVIMWSSGLEKELLIARAPGNVASFQALVHPADADFVAERLQAAIQGPDDYEAEFRMVRGDGSVRWCSARAVVVRNNAGRAVRMVGVDQDVTEKHELLRRTTDSEARLRVVYGSLAAAEAASRIGSWDWDMTTDRVYVSDSYRTLYGLPNDTVVTFDTWLNVVVPEDRERIRSATRDHLETGSRYDIEFRVSDPPGGIRWIAGLGQASRDDSGRPTRFTGVNIVITERENVEAELRRGEMRYRQVFDNAPTGIAIRATNGRVGQANRAYCDLVGYTNEEDAAPPHAADHGQRLAFEGVVCG